MIDKQTFGTFGKGSIRLVDPPLIQALSMNPLGTTLAFAGSNHVFWMIIFQTNAATFFVTVVTSLNGWIRWGPWLENDGRG